MSTRIRVPRCLYHLTLFSIKKPYRNGTGFLLCWIVQSFWFVSEFNNVIFTKFHTDNVQLIKIIRAEYTVLYDIEIDVHGIRISLTQTHRQEFNLYFAHSVRITRSRKNAPFYFVINRIWLIVSIIY